MEEIRNKGKTALRKFLNKEQNVNILEKSINDAVIIYIGTKTEAFSEIYNNIIYQMINDIINKKELKEILKSIKNNEILWKHPSLKDLIDDEIEQDDFIIQPFEIVEGIAECRCGSKRVYSYTKQTRGGDESSTTFNECLKCKSKWTYSG
jgi:DNA-directed RNA polymerase subunit M/transcription elongation factor TFIIS